jgi:ethanolamine utilization protein EutN
VTPEGKRSGKTRIALDRAQAGVGDRVLVVDEGNSARGILGDPKAAVKTVIVGVVDYVHTDRLVYDHREPRGEKVAR